MPALNRQAVKKVYLSLFYFASDRLQVLLPIYYIGNTCIRFPLKVLCT